MTRLKTFLLFLLIFCTPGASQALQYQRMDLGTFGGEWAYAAAINDSGQVLIWVIDAEGRTNTVVWHNGAVQAFFADTLLYNLNNHGYAVGRRGSTGVLWTGSGDLTVLGEFIPRDISDTGYITGEIADKSFLYKDGNMSVFSPVPDYYVSGGNCVNDLGVVGISASNSQWLLGFIRDTHGNMTPVPTFGGPSSTVVDINSSNHYVGYATYPSNPNIPGDSGEEHAFVFNGILRDLGRGVASRITDTGFIVGRISLEPHSTPRSAVWDSNLNPLYFGRDEFIGGVNAHGTLVGYYEPSVNKAEAAIWILVPEPATVIAMGIWLLPSYYAISRSRKHKADRL